MRHSCSPPISPTKAKAKAKAPAGVKSFFSGGKGTGTRASEPKGKAVDLPGEGRTRTSITFHMSRAKTALKTQAMQIDEQDHWILGNIWFTWIINACILLSAVQMGFYANRWPEGPSWNTLWTICEHAFTLIFAVEMVLKVSVLRMRYFYDDGLAGWNFLDYAICWLAIIDTWLIPIGMSLTHTYSADDHIDWIRIFRLLRLLRILKLFRTVPELMMVIEGLFKSWSSMAWIFVLLFGIIYMWSIICVEIIGRADPGTYPGFNDDQGFIAVVAAEEFNNYQYFGTVGRSIVTLLNMVLLAEWVETVRPTLEVQWFMFPFFFLLTLLGTFGLFNVIIGIIVERTTDAMNRANAETVEMVAEARESMIAELAEIMFDLDENADGCITREEMESAADGHERFLSILENLDLPHGFTFADFHLMLEPDAEGRVTKQSFITGMVRLVHGSPFQQSCLQQLAMCKIKDSIRDTQKTLLRDICSELTRLQKHQEDMQQKPEEKERQIMQWPVPSSPLVKASVASAAIPKEAVDFRPVERVRPKRPALPAVPSQSDSHTVDDRLMDFRSNLGLVLETMPRGTTVKLNGREVGAKELCERTSESKSMASFQRASNGSAVLSDAAVLAARRLAPPGKGCNTVFSETGGPDAFAETLPGLESVKLLQIPTGAHMDVLVQDSAETATAPPVLGSVQATPPGEQATATSIVNALH